VFSWVGQCGAGETGPGTVRQAGDYRQSGHDGKWLGMD